MSRSASCHSTTLPRVGLGILVNVLLIPRGGRAMPDSFALAPSLSRFLACPDPTRCRRRTAFSNTAQEHFPARYFSAIFFAGAPGQRPAR
jgi:hypothetical protein